jgi:hypothetical protein
MKFLFCIPGKTFSNVFLQCWTELVAYCINTGHEIYISQKYSSMVHFARSMCLGGDILRGINQIPFDGKLVYDYILWIDSDIVFSYKDFEKILESPHHITCGLYRMANKTHFPVVKKLDNEYLGKNGSYQFMSVDNLVKYKEDGGERYMQAEYVGMGWMLIKSGVIEKLKYPWFYHEPIEFQLGDKTIREIVSEDVSFCMNLKDIGYKIFVDTDIIVGHEKSTIL